MVNPLGFNQQPVQVTAGVIGKSGPHAIPYPLSLAGNVAQIINLQALQMGAYFNYLQTIWVDNSANPNPLIIIVSTTLQNIEFPALSQGYIPIVGTINMQLSVQTVGTQSVTLILLDYPVAEDVYSVSGSAFTFANGALVVSDPILESTVSSGAINTNENDTAAGLQVESIAVPTTSAILVPNGTFLHQVTLLNSGTVTAYIKFGAAATVASFPLAPGATVNYNFGPTNAIWGFATATGAILAITGA